MTLLVLLGVGATAGCGTSPRPTSADGPGQATSSRVQPDPGPPTAAQPDPTSPAAADPVSDRQFCRAISMNLSVLTRAASSPDDPAVEQGIAELRKLAEIAPAAIKHDLTVTADFDERVLDQIRAGDSPGVKETPELTTALSDEANWVAAHCR